MARTLFTSRAGGDMKQLANRELLRNLISLESLHFMRQTHSDQVVVVDDAEGDYDCDALVTRLPGVGLAALAADCMPITFAAKDVVAVAHVGRVGLINKISIKTVLAMRELGAQEITASIGPSICGRCYEVSSDMYQEVTVDIPATATSPQSHSLDLRAGVRAQLGEFGVKVVDVGVCTLENTDYFSYRRGGEVARQAGIICL